MGKSPKEILNRINTTTAAWENLRADKSFAGMTLARFREKLAPSLAARATIARLADELLAALNRRDDADAVSIETILLVVNAIKGDPDEGEDSELYEAMGYVRKSERKSGLSRKVKVAGTKPAA